MKIRTPQEGFTVVELMVGLLATTILSLTVGTMLVFGWRSWSHYTEWVGMQRDATIAMRSISREIRKSNIDEISFDESGIYFGTNAVRSSRIQFLATNIPYASGINIRNFRVGTNNPVTVAFTLFTDSRTDQERYVMTVKPRN